jgi:hypothetical protein
MLRTLTLYTLIVLFFCRNLHISLLFLEETITILVDDMSYYLFDLGLGVQTSWYLAISISITSQQLRFHNQCLLNDVGVELHNIRKLPSFIRR